MVQGRLIYLPRKTLGRTWSVEGDGDGPYSHPFHFNEIDLQVVGIERANLASLRVLKQ